MVSLQVALCVMADVIKQQVSPPFSRSEMESHVILIQHLDNEI